MKFSEMDGFVSEMSEPVSTRMMLFNTTDEIVGDVRVRQAISHATNKETISLGLFSGIESPADTLLAPSVPYADINLSPYDFNLETAAALLDEAGWKKVDGTPYRMKDGKELDITLNYNSNNVTDKSISEFMQGELKKIGIKLSIVGEEEQANRDRMKSGDFQFSFNISWGTPYDPQSFLAGMRKPVYGDYFAQLGLENKEELDTHILSALKSTDEESRQAHYKYVLETLHKEAVYLPLTYERNRAIFNDKVGNVTFNPSKFEVPMEKMTVDN
jgi:nickel transport system substrate-binding protein